MPKKCFCVARVCGLIEGQLSVVAQHLQYPFHLYAAFTKNASKREDMTTLLLTSLFQFEFIQRGFNIQVRQSRGQLVSETDICPGDGTGKCFTK